MRDRAYLVRLREEVNDIIRILTDHGKIRTRFNTLSSVHCYSTRAFIDCDGDEGEEVLITDASPDDMDFHKFIADELRKRGVGDVWIQTEW